jgi:hypothetical protein
MRKLAIVAVCLSLAALSCTKSKEPSASPTNAPSASVAATITPAATPCSVAGADMLTRTVESSAATAAVTDVRYSDQGCAKIVFQFGDHTPGYKIGYASPPFADCGSGKTEDTSAWGATNYLQIRLAPSGGVDLSKSGDPTYKGSRDIAVDGKTLKRLKVTCDFEAVFTWIAGLNGKHAFNVKTLKSPPRLEIDISETTATG